MALTDHDTVSGIAEGLETSKGTGLTFIPGVEISTMWGGSCIHVVGLNIQFDDTKLKEALLQIQKGRFQRAERINFALIKAGLPSMLELALSISGAKDKSDGYILQGRWSRKIYVKMSVMFFLTTLSKESQAMWNTTGLR